MTERVVKSGQRFDKRFGARLQGGRKGGSSRKRVENPRFRKFEDWGFKERALHSFEMVCIALLEDAQRQKQELEEELTRIKEATSPSAGERELKGK